MNHSLKSSLKGLSQFYIFTALLFQFADPAWASNSIPTLPNNLKCTNMERDPMPYMNEIVLSWKTSTDNTFKSQALVQGKITEVYRTQTNSRGLTHTKFAIDLDAIPGGDLEVIFNDEFGPLPALSKGVAVVVCGQYITANRQSKLPSPMGAIIHWVHYNPGDRDGGRQPGGFVIVNGKPYGFSVPNQLQ